MSIAFKDYYASLGVARDASVQDIKQAFRKLARKHHPDVAKVKLGAEEKFKEINEAHEVLSDPEKRRKYDQLGANWQEENHSDPTPGQHRRTAPAREFNFAGTGFSDFFEHYFSAAGQVEFGQQSFDSAHPAATRHRQGGHVEGDLLVTLEEVMHGAVRPISLQITQPLTGELTTREFHVRIPPGVTDGQRIRVPGQGVPGSGGASAGDLLLRVRHAAHPDFHTEGTDVYHTLTIAPWEAVLGADITVPTLDGKVKLRIPPASESGQQLRIRGRGLPKGKSGERGDFHAVLTIQFPTNPGPTERTLWEKLRATSHFNPRP